MASLPGCLAPQQSNSAFTPDPKHHPCLGNALKNMAKLYEKAGRKDEAAALRKELAALEAKQPAPPPASK